MPKLFFLLLEFFKMQWYLSILPPMLFLWPNCHLLWKPGTTCFSCYPLGNPLLKVSFPHHKHYTVDYSPGTGVSHDVLGTKPILIHLTASKVKRMVNLKRTAYPTHTITRHNTGKQLLMFSLHSECNQIAFLLQQKWRTPWICQDHTNGILFLL